MLMNKSASVQKGGDENECIHLPQMLEENSALVHPTLDGVTTYWVKLTCENKDFLSCVPMHVFLVSRLLSNAPTAMTK